MSISLCKFWLILLLFLTNLFELLELGAIRRPVGCIVIPTIGSKGFVVYLFFLLVVVILPKVFLKNDMVVIDIVLMSTNIATIGDSKRKR